MGRGKFVIRKYHMKRLGNIELISPKFFTSILLIFNINIINFFGMPKLLT